MRMDTIGTIIIVILGIIGIVAAVIVVRAVLQADIPAWLKIMILWR